MSDSQEKEPDPKIRVKKVKCHRTGQQFDLSTHGHCPYCYGEEGDVESGRHEKFCDFRPGIDPVNFGFPEDSSRDRSG